LWHDTFDQRINGTFQNYLEGASQVGMQAIRLHATSENIYEEFREGWDKPTISSLKEAITLIG
jgi:hypothetical protein